ncbi:MAG: hypothetical protein KI790_13855 [Cyclobacteriaceae bacterium]|nr:hypothetical protein [Cyclobacteriaceae bacterium HetDA_MAG_MS6]
MQVYVKSFYGEIAFIQKYADTSYEVSASFKQKIAHAEFKSDYIHFYISDGFEGQKATIGNNVALSILFTEEAEQLHAYEVLKVEGTVTMDFTQTSADSKLVTLIDKFGIHWYLNLEKP